MNQMSASVDKLGQVNEQIYQSKHVLRVKKTNKIVRHLKTS